MAGLAVGAMRSAQGQTSVPQVRPNKLYDYGVRSRFVISKHFGLHGQRSSLLDHLPGKGVLRPSGKVWFPSTSKFNMFAGMDPSILPTTNLSNSKKHLD